MEIEIAKVGFHLEMEAGELSRGMSLRYANFVPARPTPAGSSRKELWIEETLAAPPAREGRVRVRALEMPGSYRIARSDFECRADLRTGRIRARVVPSLFAFDALLRIVLTLVLAEEGGLLLHSAGLMREGRAFLFFGRSGAGKSTVTRLAAGTTILSDEIVAVREEGGAFHAYGTPFWGEMGRPGEPVSGPVAALLRLGRPPGPTLERIEPSVAARSLLRSVLYFGGSSGDTGQVLATCLGLVRSVPCYHVRPRLHGSIWEQLNELG